MRQMSVLAASMAALASILGAAVLGLADTPLSSTATTLIVLGLAASSLVTLVGFLLVRAPWGRFGLVATAVAGIVAASVATGWFTVLVDVLGAVAIVLLLGPWLRFWTRLLPSVDGPGRIPFLLMLTAPVAPAVVGVGAWDHGGWQFWLAAIVAVVSSLLYAWAVPAAVWLLRVAVPLGTVPAIVEAPWPSVVVLICGVVVVTVAAWMPAATAVASSPSPVLPTPVRRSTGEATDAPR